MGSRIRPIWRRMLLYILSAGTALWLAGQVAVAVKKTNDPWPFLSPVSMLRSTTQPAAYPTRILVKTRDGRLRRVRPADLGVPSLFSYLKHVVSGPPERRHVTAATKVRFARVVAAWDRLHPSTPVVWASVQVEVIPVRTRAKARFYELVRWPLRGPATDSPVPYAPQERRY